MKKRYLVLADGSIFPGEAFGADVSAIGEAVFTTGMCGYLETLTDPSYYGQIVLQTFPLIGNYGVIPEDFEGKCHVRGYVVREVCDTPSNFRFPRNAGRVSPGKRCSRHFRRGYPRNHKKTPRVRRDERVSHRRGPDGQAGPSGGTFLHRTRRGEECECGCGPGISRRGNGKVPCRSHGFRREEKHCPRALPPRLPCDGGSGKHLFGSGTGACPRTG